MQLILLLCSELQVPPWEMLCVCVDVVSVLSGSCVLFIVTAVIITYFAHKFLCVCEIF